jgi:hypothetical protein
MGSVVYAIEAFPNDDLLWRIDWIGGVQHNLDAPSDPLIDVCLAQLPQGEANPLSTRSLAFNAKTTAKITVGLLPFISIASVWQRRRPVVTNLEAYRRRLKIDTSLCRTALLGDLAMRFRVIPKRSYFFGHVLDGKLNATERGTLMRLK